MAAREKRKSLKSRAQEVIQGVVEALESLLPSPQPKLIPVRVRSNPAPRTRRR